MELSEKVLIGTVGYHLLSNHSVGPILLPKLKEMNWSDNVFVDEMNWGPIAIVQQLETLKTPYDRILFLVAIERPGRKIGDINIFQWQGGLPDEKQIQACVGDAATGVISIDNLLVIGEFFKVWPKEVYLIDVEPGPEKAGEHLTMEVEAKTPEILATIKRLANGSPSDMEAITYLKGEVLFNELNYGS